MTYTVIYLVTHEILCTFVEGTILGVVLGVLLLLALIIIVVIVIIAVVLMRKKVK